MSSFNITFSLSLISLLFSEKLELVLGFWNFVSGPYSPQNILYSLASNKVIDIKKVFFVLKDAIFVCFNFSPLNLLKDFNEEKVNMEFEIISSQ